MQINRGLFNTRAECQRLRQNVDYEDDTKVKKQELNIDGYHRAIVKIKGTGPVSSIIAHRDNAQVVGNYIFIELAKSISRQVLSEQEIARLGELGAKPVIVRQSTAKNTPRFSLLEVANYRETWQVIDWLFRHSYVTVDEKKKVESCLWDVTTWAEYAKTRAEDIKHVQGLLFPYVEAFMCVQSASTMAERYFSDIVDAILNCGSTCDDLNENKSEIIAAFCTKHALEDREFLDQLYLLGFLYVFPKNLTQVFTDAPKMSDLTVQKIIWDSITLHKKAAKVEPAQVTEQFQSSTAHLTYKTQNNYLKI